MGTHSEGKKKRKRTTTKRKEEMLIQEGHKHLGEEGG